MEENNGAVSQIPSAQFNNNNEVLNAMPRASYSETIKNNAAPAAKKQIDTQNILGKILLKLENLELFNSQIDQRLSALEHKLVKNGH